MPEGRFHDLGPIGPPGRDGPVGIARHARGLGVHALDAHGQVSGMGGGEPAGGRVGGRAGITDLHALGRGLE
jgi:hypothetical protein